MSWVEVAHGAGRAEAPLVLLDRREFWSCHPSLAGAAGFVAMMVLIRNPWGGRSTINWFVTIGFGLALGAFLVFVNVREQRAAEKREPDGPSTAT